MNTSSTCIADVGPSASTAKLVLKYINLAALMLSLALSLFNLALVVRVLKHRFGLSSSHYRILLLSFTCSMVGNLFELVNIYLLAFSGCGSWIWENQTVNPLNFVSAEFKALAVAFYQFVLVNRFNSINNISSILKQRWIFLLVLAFLGSLYAIMLFFVFPVGYLYTGNPSWAGTARAASSYYLTPFIYANQTIIDIYVAVITCYTVFREFRQRVLKSSSSGKSSKTLQSFIHHLHHSSQKTDFYLILTLAAWVGILMTMTLLYIIYWILDRVLGIDEDEVFTPFTAIFFILFIFFEIQSTVSLWFLAFVRDWSRAIAGKQLVAVLPPPQQPLGDKQQNHHQKQEQHQSFVEDAETGRAVMAEDDFASLDAGLPKLTYSPVKGVPGGGGGVSIGIRKKLVRYIKASSATSDSITPSELKQYTDDESVSANGV